LSPSTSNCEIFSVKDGAHVFALGFAALRRLAVLQPSLGRLLLEFAQPLQTLKLAARARLARP
jgi:hypothetical protein